MAHAGSIPQNLLDAMRELSLPLQLAFYRRYHKITQGELAEALDLKQAYLSRLEEDPSEHLLSHYVRIAKELGARLAVLPPGARIVLAGKIDS